MNVMRKCVACFATVHTVSTVDQNNVLCARCLSREPEVTAKSQRLELKREISRLETLLNEGNAHEKV